MKSLIRAIRGPHPTGGKTVQIGSPANLCVVCGERIEFKREGVRFDQWKGGINPLNFCAEAVVGAMHWVRSHSA